MDIGVYYLSVRRFCAITYLRICLTFPRIVILYSSSPMDDSEESQGAKSPKISDG